MRVMHESMTEFGKAIDAIAEALSHGRAFLMAGTEY